MASARKTGVILAAGLGSRLADHFDKKENKPLALVQGERLILRTLRSLERAGCTKIVIVLGHNAEALQSELQGMNSGKAELVFAYNAQYKLQNGISVLTAEPFVEDESGTQSKCPSG